MLRGLTARGFPATTAGWTCAGGILAAEDR